MLVQITQSYSSVHDAKAVLEVLKKTPGFILGYLLRGKEKTSLVFLCNGPDGNVTELKTL